MRTRPWHPLVGHTTPPKVCNRNWVHSTQASARFRALKIDAPQKALVSRVPSQGHPCRVHANHGQIFTSVGIGLLQPIEGQLPVSQASMHESDTEWMHGSTSWWVQEGLEYSLTFLTAPQHSERVPKLGHGPGVVGQGGTPPQLDQGIIRLPQTQVTQAKPGMYV